MAEAIFADLVEKAGLSGQIAVDSAGTSAWHIGESAHTGTRRTLAEHGIIYQGRARQITPTDLAEFDYLIALDQDNLADLQAMRRPGQKTGQMAALLSFAANPVPADVPDPYYTGNFAEVYRLALAGCQGLLAHIRAEHRL